MSCSSPPQASVATRARRELFQQQHGVNPDVALGVEFGRLGNAAQAHGFGQHARQQSERIQQLEAAAGAALGQDAGQFVAHALLADLMDVRGVAMDGGGRALFNAVVQARGEAGGTQHTQLVLGEAKLGIADRANDAGGKVLATVDIVDYGCSGVAGGRLVRERVQQHPVDGEVAAQDIFARVG